MPRWLAVLIDHLCSFKGFCLIYVLASLVFIDRCGPSSDVKASLSALVAASAAILSILLPKASDSNDRVDRIDIPLVLSAGLASYLAAFHLIGFLEAGPLGEVIRLLGAGLIIYALFHYFLLPVLLARRRRSRRPRI